MILPPRGYMAMSRDILVTACEVLMASRAQRPGMLLTILQYTGQTFCSKYQPKMSQMRKVGIDKGPRFYFIFLL